MKIAYHCCECRKQFETDELLYLCPDCSPAQKRGGILRGALRVELPTERLRRELNPATFHARDLLPLPPGTIPAYPVGDTPLTAPDRLRRELGFAHLHLKDDSLNPTGSLKDRASLLVAAQARHLGMREIVMASTGNAASAMAGVAAFCGLKAKVYVPETAPAAKLAQARAFGAEVIPVAGTYDEAYELSLEDSRRSGGLNRNTAYNPMTIEGKKTVALEIFQQLGGKAPDLVFVPVGDGVILAGVAKGFADLQALGWIEEVPRLVAVQAEGSDVIVSALESGGRIEPRRGARTVADSILVEAPRNGIMAVQDLESAKGFGVRVSDEAILQAQLDLARLAGCFAEPAAACAYAGFLASRDVLAKVATVVVLITGSGLKDIAAVTAAE